MFRTIISFSLILVVVFGVVAVARAQSIAPPAPGFVNPPAPGVPTGELPPPTGHTTFEALITDIITWLINIGSLVAVAMIIYAGFLFMTAAGNEIKLGKAKNTLIWSLVGLGVLLLSWSFIYIIKDVLGIP